MESHSSTATATTRPELLAPAGDWDCVRAAVENGADAVYFGLDKFNARMRADNFTESDLPRLMEFLHGRGVKGYVTLNTLVFENELADAEQYLRTMIAAGVDAVIVQDVGICRLIRRLSPDFPIHASTQMTVTSPAGVDFARRLGCNLVVLARECSIPDIARIAQPSTLDPRPSTLPIEVFVHGALCVAYSGQCLTSESLGGRSANRGECAQACRMPYELIADGTPVPLGDRKYLLSPQDLAGLPALPDLVRAGVASLKIEGRLKTAEYVANITRIYREALDRADLAPADPGETGYRLEMAFSRGLYTGWMRGINNQELVHGRFGKKRGVYLGTVRRLVRDGIQITLEAPLKPGDGVVFDAGHPEEPEEGGRVYQVRKAVEGRGSRVESQASRDSGRPTALDSRLSTLDQIFEVCFGHGDVDFSRVQVGDKVWKTSDPELDRKLRQTFAGDEPKFQRPLRLEVHGAAGLPLTLIANDGDGHVARAESRMPLQPAERAPLSEEKLRDQLGRLGGTPFQLERLENKLSGDLILPVSELNRLRRDAVAELSRLRALPRRWTLNPAPAPVAEPAAAAVSVEPQLIALVRNLAQLEAALDSGLRTVYCEFEDPKRYREAIATVRSRGPGAAEIWVAPPRIFKIGEEWILKQVLSSDADGYLVRNFDHLEFFEGKRRIGDYSLNVANRFSAEYFRGEFGLERLTASYDLNGPQLEALLRGAPPGWFEVTLHQHMPMFHMEHCVFCAFLSEGTDYRNCGRPCDRLDVQLRDRVGVQHPVKADAGCRNTVFNGRAQSGAELAPQLLELGVRHFRIEFLNETADEVREGIRRYGQLLRGEISGAQVWRDLRAQNQLGVTRGPKRA
ncbi:MAG: DUF3656 domain-containing protein [Verrucomicrobiota bacterium]